MTPFYFGNSDCPLYGVLHEPTAGPFRELAVLICQPIGHEYYRSHRALQILAKQLADQGYFVLRFDYQGNGDSSGDFETQRMIDWQNNTMTACDELLAMSGASQVTPIGVRYAANIILASGIESVSNRFILCDPVLDGNEDTQILNSIQDAAFSEKWIFPVKRSKSDLHNGEFLGFIYSDDLLSQMRAVHLNTQIGSIPNKELNIYLSKRDEVKVVDLESSLQSISCLDDECNWHHKTDIDRSISMSHFNQSVIELLG